MTSKPTVENMYQSVPRQQSEGNHIERFLSLRKERMKSGALSFLGIENKDNERDAWNQRRLRMCVSKFGSIKTGDLNRGYDTTQSTAKRGESVALSRFRQAGHRVIDLQHQQDIQADSTLQSAADRQFSTLSHSIYCPLKSYQEEDSRRMHTKRNAFRTVYDTLKAKRAMQHAGAGDGTEDEVGPASDEHNRSAEPTETFGFLSSRTPAVTEPKYVDEHKEEPTTDTRQVILVSNVMKRMQRSEAFDDEDLPDTKNEQKEPAQQKHRVRFYMKSAFAKLLTCNFKDQDTKKFVDENLEDCDYRPYFTYWICFVQVIIFITSVAVYGFAPISFSMVSKSNGEVMRPTLAIERVCREEWHNFWLGPRQADLVRLGARYTPCMRSDPNLEAAIFEVQRERDRNSGCCVRNDGSGCYQSARSSCSEVLSTWYSWKNQKRRDGRKSGPVCGEDPQFCQEPMSHKPYEWLDDVSRWPICRRTRNATTIKKPECIDEVCLRTSGSLSHESKHMTCEVTGRPCCVGIKGECIITTREHCDFMRGYYHQEAFLCSQVNCLNEICGMLPFLHNDRPDQFYRVYTSLFLHAGVIHLGISLAIQLIFMRDLEKMAGWFRIAIIYLFSGCCGNLMSGIFVPYQVESGPTGSHFGLLGMTIVEFILSWQFVKNRFVMLAKYLLFTGIAFLIGFLPWIDNYAHLIGFISGFLLSLILLPYASFGSSDPSKEPAKRRLTLVISSVLWVIIFILLIVGFFVFPVTECSFCKYLNCLPIGPNFCENMDVNITSKTTCIIDL